MGAEELEFWQSWNTNMPEEVPLILAHTWLRLCVGFNNFTSLNEFIYFSSIARGASGPDKPRKRDDSMPVDQRETVSLRELP